MIRIFDLNLWNYNKFEERKPRIIEAVKKYDPDIIALQEVRDDLRFNIKGHNQARQLNDELKYKYSSFMKTMDINVIQDRVGAPYCIEGLAVLSKYPITKVIKKRLKQHTIDKFTRGILCANINKGDTLIEVCVVHFSPGGFFGKLHLDETLRYFKKRQMFPVIMGDFNIDDQDYIVRLASKDYEVSNDFNACVTLPETERTIDDILIPKKFKFKKFFCAGKELSDHRALIAELFVC